MFSQSPCGNHSQPLYRNPPNVLSLVNKGLALFQWKQDIGAAERCCNEALRIDPSCEAAVATLAQLNLQQSKIEKAVEMFSRQAELARSEPELVNALTYQFVSVCFGVVGFFSFRVFFLALFWLASCFLLCSLLPMTPVLLFVFFPVLVGILYSGRILCYPIVERKLMNFLFALLGYICASRIFA
jgi:tetratricopeptide (TPR) repeat protein